MFFFASRRRHTRFDCDWSSDVCSSDLAGTVPYPVRDWPQRTAEAHFRRSLPLVGNATSKSRKEIGRASCRKEGRSRGSLQDYNKKSYCKWRELVLRMHEPRFHT